ncbi:Hint domain-containing protein [Shimia sp. SDUM112013]|uniref:Hint domain-containing protein n=1 Tax=Shimia sp. SDUM112013 TaxID=3136160 RepID=UPI0032ED5FBE
MRAGDLVLTRDDGPQMLRWIGGATVALRDPDLVANLSPVRIRPHAIGPGIPAQDLFVSPQHRILISQTDTALLFGESEVFCAPAHLLKRGDDHPGTRPIRHLFSSAV